MLDNATYQKYLDEARSSAMARLGDSPVYNAESENETLRRNLLDQINNRKKFSYNINEDGLYNVYRDKYIQQGRMAMRDTMGQVAALTGGYGNSYGQAVGQQAYDRALQNLNDVVPQLYGQAFSMYQEEGNQLQKQYAMASDLVGEDWTKYRAAVSDWQTNRAVAEEQAQAAAKAAYQLEADAYKNLTTLIGSTGYIPTEEELATAGMSVEAAAALRTEYLRATKQLKKKSSGGGGGGGGGGSSGSSSSSESSGTGNGTSGGATQAAAQAGRQAAIDKSAIANATTRGEVARAAASAKSNGSISSSQYNAIMKTVH